MAEATRFGAVVKLNGVDIYDQILGEISTGGDSSTSKLAKFVMMPNAGTINAGEYIGADVEIFHTDLDSAGLVIATNPLFVGKVDTAIYNPKTGLIPFTCSDELQAKMEAKTQAEIDALIINSRYSEAVFGEFKDGWQHLENLLKTYPQDYDLNINGVTATLVDWAAKTIPDFSYDASQIVDGSITYSTAPKSDLVNKHTIRYGYRFTRLLHREHSFSWSLKFCPWFDHTHELPTKEMVTTAASSAGWKLSSNIEFTELPENAQDPCGTGAVWVVTEERRNLLILGAKWRVFKRWSQHVTENYVINVTAPQSIAWLGEIAFEEHSSNETDFDADGWKDGGGTITPPGAINLNAVIDGTGTPIGRTNSIDDIVVDKFDRTVSDNDIEADIARAMTETLSSHRANYVSAEIELNPLLERYHTVYLSAGDITGQGKVYGYLHRLNPSEGYARTDITIAISLNGGAAAGGDSAIAAPVAPDTDPTSAAPTSSTLLDMHIGNDDTVDNYVETWDGFTGNYSLPVGTPTPEQFYPRRFMVVTPNINQDSVDAAEGEVTANYSFDIPDELLTITVT